MSSTEENNNKIIDFLREVANSIEQQEVDENTLQSAGEFFMKNLFTKEIEKVDFTLEEKDILKFLTMGWYIYTIYK